MILSLINFRDQVRDDKKKRSSIHNRPFPHSPILSTSSFLLLTVFPNARSNVQSFIVSTPNPPGSTASAMAVHAPRYPLRYRYDWSDYLLPPSSGSGVRDPFSLHSQR